jgi:hypothetical protein
MSAISPAWNFAKAHTRQRSTNEWRSPSQISTQGWRRNIFGSSMEVLVVSVQVQKARHPFSLFCRNIFRVGKRRTEADMAKQPAITLADLTTMPKLTQLLLAHFLEQNNPELMLLDSDTDVGKLPSAGWLVSIACPTVGIRCFKIRTDVWRKLRSLRARFLTADLLQELVTYRMRKSAAYPWIW